MHLRFFSQTVLKLTGFTLPLITIFLASTGFSHAASAELAPKISGMNLLTGEQIIVSPKAKGEVIVFMSAICPCSNHHVPVVKKLAHDFPDYQFVVIHSNADESVQEAKTYFAKADFGFPVIQESDSKFAGELKALKTPHSFLVNAAGEIVYRGGVTSSATAAATDTQFLRNALEELSSGQPVKIANGRTLGCAISR